MTGRLRLEFSGMNGRAMPGSRFGLVALRGWLSVCLVEEMRFSSDYYHSENIEAMR